MGVIVIFWRWYYGEAIRDILTGWKNYIIFSLEYFSIPLLLKTLLSPWKRDITRRPRGLDLQKLFEYLSFNAISRGIGFIIRLITICIGLIFFFGVVILGALFFVIWLVLPLVLAGVFIFGIILLV